MRISSLLAPELEETLRTNPAHAAELAEELHAADLAELIDGLGRRDGRQDGGGAAGARGGGGAGRDGLPAARPDLRAAGSRAGGDHRRRRCRRTSAPTCSARCPTRSGVDLLARMPKDASLDVRELIRYPESSAGGLMTTDFVALDPEMTVESAIDQVRSTAAEKETIYEAYAVDPNGTMLGVVSLRDLVLARAGPADRRADEPRRHLGPARDGPGGRRAPVRALQHAGAAGRRSDAQDPGHRHRRRRGLGLEAGAGRGHPEAGRGRAHRGDVLPDRRSGRS